MRKWDELPPELLILILGYISGKDVFNFGLVCKSWNDVIRYSPYKNCPYIMFYKRKMEKWIFLQDDSSFSASIPDLDNLNILCSKFGWLLTRRYKGPDIWDTNVPSLFNLFSKHRIELPRRFLSYFDNYTFFNEPTSPDCVVLGFRMLTNSTVVNICLVSLDKGEYKFYSYYSNGELNVCGCSPVLRDELIFFVDMKGNILTFNMGDGTWNFHSDCLSPPDLQNKINERFLILDGEDILGIFVYSQGYKVGVYKLSDEMTWTQLHNIGDCICYVSISASFAMASPSAIMSNRIYFDKFYGGSNVFYSLASKNYESHTATVVNQENYALIKYGTWITAPQ